MYIVLFIFAVIIAVNSEECGRVSLDGRELPWQAGIYFLSTSQWECGGSIIRKNVVLTSAFCLWTTDMPVDRHVVPSDVVVAAGKFNRIWREPTDGTQWSPAKHIYLSPGFENQKDRNITIPFAENIAVVITAKEFDFNDNVQPVCLNYNLKFEMTQLTTGKGKSGGWATDEPSFIIKELYHVPLNVCADLSFVNDSYLKPQQLRILEITGDKICVGANNTKAAPCTPAGDSGTGLTYAAKVRGRSQYYLLGILSEPLDYSKTCTNETKYYYTSIRLYEKFINRYLALASGEIDTDDILLDRPPKPDTGKCVLPPYPEFGTYNINVTRVDEADAGEGLVLVALTYTCREGYGVQGSTTVSCYNGFWPEAFPKCIRMCQVKEHPSVDYQCLVSGPVVGSRACLALEPAGTLVSPVCRAPHYYSAGALGFMRCGTDGQWDYTARCLQECGRLTPDGQILVVGGKNAQRGELPWHAGIYRKTSKPYMQICGGSLISTTHIISAAHCFWTDLEKQLPASQFAAAVGKLYRPWADKMDVDAQKSDVKEIHIPDRFGGAASSFQDDIAVVVVSEPFQFRTYVRPVCLNFDPNFDRFQLQTISKGKVAGWGLTGANGAASGTLQVLELPYVEVGTCIDNSPRTFQEYITSDKICAGTLEENTALCKGDSGGGLAFASADRGTVRYYLRGVVSTAPNNDNACNTAVYTTFTQIQKHEDFIKRFLTEV